MRKEVVGQFISTIARAASRDNRAELYELSTSPQFQRHFKLLRPNEITMILHHWARLQIDDNRLWRRVSAEMPQLLIDPTPVALGILGTAHARVSMKDAAVFSRLQASALRLLSLGRMDGHSAGMLLSSFSSVRCHDAALFQALGDSLAKQHDNVDAVGFATIFNAFGRVAQPHTALFAALRSPMLASMEVMDRQHLAMLAHSHAALSLCHDKEVLTKMTDRVLQACLEETGEL
eukprot:3414131-Amphidinium_carterae.1